MTAAPIVSAAADAAAGLPFSVEEYRARLAATRAEMAARGLDLLFVTTPSNLYYLTGYEALLFPPLLPIGALISAESVTMVDWERHESYARTRVLCDDVILVSYADFAGQIAQAITDKKWRSSSIGFEWSTPTPVASIMITLSDSLRALNVIVESADGLLDTLTRYKSPAELAYVRKAAAIADDAMRALQPELRPGLTPMQVSARLMSLLADRGAEHAAMPPLVNAGPNAATDTLAFPSQRPLRDGDLLTVDCCASVARYHVYLSRTFQLGDAPTILGDAINRCAGALDALIGAAAPDAPTNIALQAAQAHVAAQVSPENIWWVGGYTLGAAFPPSWVGRDYLASSHSNACFWKPGFVSNFEILLTDQASGAAAACIDTILMTESGLKVLSSLPRTVLRAGAKS